MLHTAARAGLVKEQSHHAASMLKTIQWLFMAFRIETKSLTSLPGALGTSIRHVNETSGRNVHHLLCWGLCRVLAGWNHHCEKWARERTRNIWRHWEPLGAVTVVGTPDREPPLYGNCHWHFIKVPYSVAIHSLHVTEHMKPAWLFLECNENVKWNMK